MGNIHLAKRTIALCAATFSCLAAGDTITSGWTLGVGCGGTGNWSTPLSFTAQKSGGFTSSGQCRRTSTRFTKFSFTAAAGGTLIENTRFGLHTGDVLIVPPLLTGETQPLFTVASACPSSSHALNWIYVQWNSATALNDTYLLGEALYSKGGAITVTRQYNVNGDDYWIGNVAMPGSCNPATGVYSATGSANLGGEVYFTRLGAGVFKTGPGKATFFFPQFTVNPVDELSNWSVQGITFDSQFAANTKPVRVVSNAEGSVFTVQPYSDPEAGTIDSTYVDTLTITGANYPRPGMLVGTVTRTGTGSGTGKIACIANRGINFKVICAGQSPNANSQPYSISFIKEGAQVLGQPTPNSFVQTEMGVSRPTQSIVAGGKLIVADTGNHRVLIWNNIPTSHQQLPDVVLGQPNLASNTSNLGGTSAASLSQPYGVHSDGTRLFVSDFSNHRVLIWNAIPTTNQKAADVVLGQPDMTSNLYNNGGLSARSLAQPCAITTNGSRLFVADGNNNRVLIWNTIPSTNQRPADLVLGQPNLTSNLSNNGGVSAQSLNHPTGIFSIGTRLFVGDTYNHRVLIWNTLPTGNQQAASLVLGQPNLTSSSMNNGGQSAQSLNYPFGICSDGTRLMVADYGNSRVLIWNSLPAVNRKAADLVVGQAGMNSSAGGGITSAQSLFGNSGVSLYAGRLLVTDLTNSRILIWNAIPTINQKAADIVLGQATMSSNGANNAGLNAFNLSQPYGVGSAGTRLFVADHENNRVLIWNSIPTSNHQAADVVLGQPNVNTNIANNGGVSARALNHPFGVFSDGTRLFVADLSNNRVLIWNSIPSTNQQPADVVLGQPDMTSRDYNQGGVGAGSLAQPTGVTSDGTRLFVADSNNHRILIWNTIPTTNQQPADLVLGQPTMTANMANEGGLGARSLQYPFGVSVSGGRLFVADSYNHRVLVWNSIPAVDRQAADVVLGQPTMDSNAANNGGVSADSLNLPYGVSSDGTRLFVVDTNNHRLLGWSTTPTLNRQPADLIFGQADMTSNAPGIGENALYWPRAIFAKSTRTWVAESGNNRVLIFQTR